MTLRRTLLVSIVFLFLLSAWAFVSAGKFLERPGEPAIASDAIVVLGGCSMIARLNYAANLYERGFASTLILTGFSEGNESAIAWQQEWRVRYLIEKGVPMKSIYHDNTAKSSYMELELVKTLMQRHEWRRVMVVSDPPHMRRLSLVLSRVLGQSHLDIRLTPSAPDWWFSDSWWSNKTSGSFVLMEFIKLAYYFTEDQI